MERVQLEHKGKEWGVDRTGWKGGWISFDWIKRHPVLMVLGGVFVVVAIEYYSLPRVSAIERLKFINPRNTALIEARKTEHRGKPWDIDQRWIPLSSISSELVHAMIVAEDGTFYEHEGFDWYEVQESLERNWNEGRFARGASTITQQLAKNLFLSMSRDPIRKLKEIIITLRMERVLSKDRILELYLNLIEWGDGIFGIEAAAQHYLGKSASGLTREEAARLAAVVPSPLRHAPNSESRYVQSRTESILMRMEARGW